MPSFVPNYRELAKAYRKHVVASNLLSSSDQDLDRASAHMLLFYGVECGLKALLVMEQRGQHLEYSHDLAAIVKELRIDPAGWPQNFTIRHDPENHSSKDSHLAWRYGIRVSDKSLPQLKAGLDGLVAYLESRL